ncbi:MAG TPA: hypothetical protein PKD46_10130 [Aggregatilineaceae bacterium]|nr:hypothetical protein [Aggregatilineaceae bacterium]
MPRTRTARAHAGLIGAVLWMALILGLYYWVHKPLTPALAEALGGALLDLAVTAALAALAAGVGRRLLRPFDLAALSAPERLALAGMLGLGALSLVLAAVGMLALNALSVGLAIALAGVWARRDLLAWLAEARAWLRAGLPRAGWERALAWIAVILLALALVLATLPPARWDVLTYHLAGPQQYVAEGRFYAAPHNHFLGFPQLVETLYAAQIALTGRLTGGGPLHFWMGALALLMTGGMAARIGGRVAGWVAASLLLGAFSIWSELSVAYADLLPMALGMGALAAAERWDATGRRDRRWLALIGALAGLAMGCKYTTIWLAAALGALVVWLSRRDGVRTLAAHAAIYGATAALLALPWLARNAIWYDNPVYPFFFDGGEMSAIRQSWYAQPRSGLIYSSGAWQIPVMPLVATIFGSEDQGSYGTDPGPWFLILTPLVALVWRRLGAPERGAIERALVVAGVILAAWIVSSAVGSYGNRQTRLILYVFPPLALTGALALEGMRRLPEKPLNLGFVLRAMLTLTLALGLLSAAREALRSGLDRYYSGEEGYRDAYLDHALGWHMEAMRQANALPDGSRVRFLWEPRSLYCDGDRVVCLPDSLMDGWYTARRTVGDGSPAAIAAAWRAGADRLLVYDFGARFEREGNALYTPADWDAWERFVAAQLVVEWQGGSGGEAIYTLYRWRSP